MIEAVVTIKAFDELMNGIIIRYNVNINIKKVKITNDKSILTMMEMKIDQGSDIDDIIRQIRTNPHYVNVDFNPAHRDRITAMFKTENCPLCRILAESDCSISSSRTIDRNRVELTFLAIERKSIQRLVRNLEGIGVEPSLHKIIELSEKGALTARQEAITRMAYDWGYFDFPRKISLKELANKLNTSPSALSEILRKGQRHILNIYFNNMIQ